MVVSAVEVIEQIKALPRSEQAKVIDFMAELQKLHPNIQYASDAEFKKAADEVFKKHDELLRRLAS
jgi:hypothetical protein